MKYKIHGIKKEMTIESIQIIDSNKDKKSDLGIQNDKKIKVIIVNYLDGTQDVFEFNEEMLNKIKNIIDDQAGKFLRNSEEDDEEFVTMITGSFSAMFGIVALSACFFQAGVITVGIMSLVSAALATMCIKSSKKTKSIKKHRIYLEQIASNLDEYNKILENEKSYQKQKEEPIEIVNVDQYSLTELKRMANKLKYNQNIEDKTNSKVFVIEKKNN